MKPFLHLLLFLSVAISAGARAGVYDDMIVAIRNDDSEKVISLLQRGMDVNTADREGTTLTMYASRAGDKQLLEYLLKHRANILIKNKHGDSALHLAALHGHPECVQMLVNAGAEVNPRGEGWTALNYAAFSGRPEVAAFLIGEGAQIDARAPNGMTSLMLAARNGHATVVQLLLKTGADTSLRTPDGKTALDIARAANQEQIAALLASTR